MNQELPKEEILHVRITNATKVLWEGEARAVSSQNSDGPFDILSYHANFITLIRGVPITVTVSTGEKQTYDFKEAVLYVKENEVKIYGDVA